MWKNESHYTFIYIKKITQYTQTPDQLAPSFILYSQASIELASPYAKANSIDASSLNLRVDANSSDTYVLIFFLENEIVN